VGGGLSMSQCCLLCQPGAVGGSGGSRAGEVPAIAGHRFALQGAAQRECVEDTALKHDEPTRLPPIHMLSPAEAEVDAITANAALHVREPDVSMQELWKPRRSASPWHSGNRGCFASSVR